jgi:hypothetical protein
MKEKLANVTNKYVCLQTVAQLMITTVTVPKTYCNSLNK